MIDSKPSSTGTRPIGYPGVEDMGEAGCLARLEVGSMSLKGLLFLGNHR